MKIYSNYKLPQKHEDYCEHPTFVDDVSQEIKSGYPPPIVDSSQHIEMEELVKKYVNIGGVLPKIDGVIEDDPNEIIDNINPARLDGFDLADVQGIINRAKEAEKKLSQLRDEVEKKSKEEKPKGLDSRGPAPVGGGQAATPEAKPTASVAAIPGAEGAR